MLIAYCKESSHIIVLPRVLLAGVMSCYKMMVVLYAKLLSSRFDGKAAILEI